MPRATFNLTDADTFATVYAPDGSILGTIHRPYATRAFQNAVPQGDHFRVYDRDGTLKLATRLRPTSFSVYRALSN